MTKNGKNNGGGGAGQKRRPKIWMPEKYNFNRKSAMNDNIRTFY